MGETRAELDTRETIVSYFSACPLCGCFLASLLALLGNKSLDNALEKGAGPWLEFPWQTPMAETLATHYDWRLELDTEMRSGRCPTCLRRIVYHSMETGKILQVERRPGSRI